MCSRSLKTTVFRNSYTAGRVIAGMVVMVVSPEDDETVFVNIVGQIDPEQIGRIGRKFDIDPLDEMTVDF